FAGTPKLAGTPAGARFPLTAFLITWVIGASALLIASNTVSKKSDFLYVAECAVNRSLPNLTRPHMNDPARNGAPYTGHRDTKEVSWHDHSWLGTFRTAAPNSQLLASDDPPESRQPSENTTRGHFY